MFENYALHAQQSDARARELLAAGTADMPLVAMLNELSAGGGPRRRMPASLLTGRRDLTKGTASAGGYLVGTDVGAWQPLLRGVSVAAEAGLRLITGLTGDLTIPKATSGATAYWLSTEGTAITASQPAFGQVALSPKVVGILVRASRQLLMQGAAAESIVRDQILTDFGAELDRVIFQGSGSSGQPQGVLSAGGTFSQSGTSLGHTGLLAMLEAVTLAGARYSRLTWFCSPASAEVLGGRERASGSGFNLDAGQILGRPCVVTNAVPSGSLVLTDPSLIALALFDAAGAAVERDDNSSFTTGVAAFRLLMGLDIAVLVPGAVAKATSIT